MKSKTAAEKIAEAAQNDNWTEFKSIDDLIAHCYKLVENDHTNKTKH